MRRVVRLCAVLSSKAHHLPDDKGIRMQMRWLGRMLSGVRPGPRAIVSERLPVCALPDVIVLASVAFEDGARMPARHTQDGTGVSPALQWKPPPAGCAGYALLVEDADPPWPRPVVHALVTGIPAEMCAIAEGGLPHFRDRAPAHDPRLVMGRNVYGGRTWIPPGPVPGHGPHRYVFQIFAFARDPALPARCSRAQLVQSLAQCGSARGMLTGVYERA